MREFMAFLVLVSAQSTGVTLGLAYIGKDSMTKQDKLSQETVNTVTDKIYALSKTSCSRDSLLFTNVTKDRGSMISTGVLQIDANQCQDGKSELGAFLLVASSSRKSELNKAIQSIYEFPATYIAQLIIAVLIWGLGIQPVSKDPFITNMIIIAAALIGLACMGITAFVLASDNNSVKPAEEDKSEQVQNGNSNGNYAAKNSEVVTSELVDPKQPVDKV